MSKFYQLMGVGPGPFDPDNRFVTSWLLSPIIFACLRGTMAIYAFAAIFTIWGWDGTHEPRELRHWFSYFTSLSYCGLAFYLLVAAFHTFTYALHGTTLLQKWPRPLQALHALFYTTMVNFPFLVTLVFWIVIYVGPGFLDTFDAFSNVSQHALNSFFALLELFLSATNPPPWLHLVFLIVILLLYLGLAYLAHATEGFYVYDFLDPSNGKGRVAEYTAGIAAGILVIFLITWFLIWVRRRFTGPGKKSRRDSPKSEAVQDVEMLQQRPK